MAKKNSVKLPEKTYRIESPYELVSEWLSPEAFTKIYTYPSVAVAIAIEGVENPAEEEVCVICVEDGEVYWRSTEDQYT